MTILLLIGLFCLVVWGVYMFVPRRGFSALVACGIIVGAFLSLVYLTKLVILA